MKGRIFLIHWKASEAEGYAKNLRSAGWNVVVESEDGSQAYKLIKANLPHVAVIYLSRLPSHGRETGDALRSLKARRNLPIVFVDGKEEVAEKTRAKLPDAVFTTSAELGNVLARFSNSDGTA